MYDQFNHQFLMIGSLVLALVAVALTFIVKDGGVIATMLMPFLYSLLLIAANKEAVCIWRVLLGIALLMVLNYIIGLFGIVVFIPYPFFASSFLGAVVTMVTLLYLWHTQFNGQQLARFAKIFAFCLCGIAVLFWLLTYFGFDDVFAFSGINSSIWIVIFSYALRSIDQQNESQESA